METKKTSKMARFVGFMIVLCLADVFAATTTDELFQKAISAIEQRDIDVAKSLLGAVLACDDANDVLKIKCYHLRARLNFGNPELAKSDCNSAVVIAKNVITTRLNGNAELSQTYLIDMCKAYGSTLTVSTALLCERSNYSEAAILNQSYAADVLKLGTVFDVNGQRQVIDFAKIRWLDAAETMVKAPKLADAHKIYGNGLQAINSLNWAKPEMIEATIYTMQMGSLITSDANNQAFGAAAADLIEKNKTKPWVVRSSIDVIGLINLERQYELHIALIKAQPSAADDHSMALLYRLATTTAREIGQPEEAVTYFKVLKQKYPNDPLSKLP